MATFDPTTSKYYVKFDRQTIETTVTNKAAIANEWASEVLLKYAGIEAAVAKARVNEMYSHYAGKGDVSDSEWTSDLFSKYAGEEVVVGLDYEHANNKLATFQVCIADKCLVLQLLHLDELPQILERFVAYCNEGE